MGQVCKKNKMLFSIKYRVLGKTRIKKIVFFSGRTTKGVGKGNPSDHLFFYKGENSPGSPIILFYEARHFSPNFTGSKTILAFFSPKMGEKIVKISFKLL